MPIVSTLAPGKIIKLQYNMDIIDETGTFYVDNFEYGFNGCDPGWYWVDKVYNPEGYVTTSNDITKYHYFRKDHLGNNREVWRAAYTNTSGTVAATTLQRTQYYPSGLPWAESTGQDVQNKKYNGKEFVEAHGLDEYDSEARWYYPAIMRTTTLDPLAEKYYSISPYAWCGNNPVNRIDPDGRIIVDTKGRSALTIDNKGNVHFTKYATNDIKRVVNSLSSTKTGRSQLQKANASDIKVKIKLTADNKIEKKADGTHYTYGETVQGNFDKNDNYGRKVNSDGSYGIKEATITIYEGTIKEDAKTSSAKHYGLTTDQAIGAVAGHELVHATDKSEINEDIKAEREGKTRNDQEVKTNDIEFKIIIESWESIKIEKK